VTSTAAAPTPAHALSASRTILSAVAIVVVGAGLISSTAAVRAADEGFGTATIGLLGSANYAGFFLGAVIGPSLVARVGHIRVYASLASLCASATLVLPTLVTPFVWMPIRFVMGLSMSGIYIVVESWLNSVATNANRGRLLALYLVASNLAFGAGQLLFVLTDPSTMTPFLVASAICSLSVLPLSLGVTPAPSHEIASRRLPIRQVLRAAPLAPATSFISGIGGGVIVSLGAVYGAVTGMSDHQIGGFVAAGVLGGIVLQWPIGSLSDRLPRRLVILGVNVFAAAFAVLGANMAEASIGVFVALAGYCAISFPLYSLAMSHLNDVIEPELRTPAGGVLMLAFGAGSVSGPYLASLLMSWDPVGFWFALAFSNLAITPYLTYRIATRPRIAHRWKHVAFDAEVTPAPVVLVDHDVFEEHPTG
jgi:MFS family permease